MTFEELYTNDIFANENGVRLLELNDNGARMCVLIERKHLNGVNIAHGGLIYLLADITMAAMANYKQLGSVSLQADIRFLAAAREGDTLTARAEMVSGRKKFNNCRVNICNQNGDLVAIGEGMFYAKG